MVITKRDLVVSIVSCSILVACAAFPYRHYAYDFKNNVLLGDKPENDLPAEVCKEAGGSKFPCMVMLTDEFFTMKSDFLKTKQALIDCEKGNPPSPN